MNNKGFTLIELLATVVLLSLVLGIAGVGILNVIENSKSSSEKVFVERLSDSIDDYVDLMGSTLKQEGTSYTFDKCVEKSCKNTYSVMAYLLVKSDGSSVTLKDVIKEGLIDEDEVVNPKNHENCLVEKDPDIKIYRDSEYVYYYYLDLSGSNTSCSIGEENSVIDTLPSKLKEEVDS